MTPLSRARHLAFLRTEIVEPRPLSHEERQRRADDYLLAHGQESLWIRAWSQVMTWHLDKVERHEIYVLVAGRIATHRMNERRAAQQRHPTGRKPSPRPRTERGTEPQETES